MVLEKLQELFPEMVEGVQWDLAEGGFRNVFDFLASLRVAELTKIFDDENLPLTHGVMWSELDRNIGAFANRMSRQLIIATSFATCRCTILVALILCYQRY